MGKFCLLLVVEKLCKIKAYALLFLFSISCMVSVTIINNLIGHHLVIILVPSENEKEMYTVLTNSTKF